MKAKISATVMVAAVVGVIVVAGVAQAAPGDTTLVSVSSSGTLPVGNKASYVSSVSADGRYVAFESSASNLVSRDTKGARDIFVRDRRDGTTERVSVDNSGIQGNRGSRFPSINTDGRYVVFCSDASNLVAGDTNDKGDIFVHEAGR